MTCLQVAHYHHQKQNKSLAGSALQLHWISKSLTRSTLPSPIGKVNTPLLNFTMDAVGSAVTMYAFVDVKASCGRHVDARAC